MTLSALVLGSYHLGDAIVVRPTGRLDLSTYAKLRDSLLKIAADEPVGIVVQLGDEFEFGSDSVANVFSTVWMRISEWPGVPVVVAAETAAHRETMVDSGVHRFVRYFATLRDAVTALGSPPPRRRDHVQLPPALIASRLSRQFIEETCGRWGVDDVLDDALVVTSELVENAVRHTASGPRLRLELRPGQLSIAVRDSDPTPPALREPDDRGGHGLPLVATISRAWGTAPSLDGKVVWAVLDRELNPRTGHVHPE
ncbi:ATP-binding protein [Umezawaea beigongshangensis]|uniref:ATP-binding protein n=1 Tax=Umezawaea beigongshangensis TaxID=2780383 RepID=UPI0018F10C75|nr:ATP-binding protein [Umezawaea beigongshangensis]